ncbi:MAG: lysophospholipid acyltransferase family protein, partial [Bacteroidales bacterium]
MIKAISFGLVYGFVKLFSLLPFWFLNGVGRVIFILLDNVIHYREKIIIRNLENAFPGKSAQEIKKIKSRFYRYFSRLLVENIKMFNFPLTKLEKYIYLENPELIKDYYERGISVSAIAAHYGNWEWLLGLKRDIPHHSIGIFKSLNNQYFNNFFTRHRSAYG